MNIFKRFDLMFVICQTIGVTSINSIPNIATSHGPLGSIAVFIGVYILFGIPLIYMEFIIGQFTGRDCIDVWKIRPFLSYTGFILILWQVIILIYNHIFVSFTMHYFLISFENPIPYYKCGPWSTSNCNILNYNYTFNEDCMKRNRDTQHCETLHSTFPELQYWRNKLLGLEAQKHFNLHIAWRVCLASGLVCVFLYLSCFKRKQSLRWVVTLLPIYSILGFVLVMMGSMLQRGLVATFEYTLDLDFHDFVNKSRVSNVIQQVIYNLGIGSGLGINFASISSFHFNCFSNGVLAVVISTVFSVLVTCTTIIMTCPYTYQHGLISGMIIKAPMSLVFEKIPRLLSQFDKRLIWIILIYSCYVTVCLCSHALVFYNLLETIFSRSKKVSNYPGLTCLVAAIILYFTTISLLSNIGITCALAFRRYVTLVSTFIAMLECIVFVILYGVHKFSEDVHFMLGIQPSVYMKIAWLSSAGFLGYTFCNELIYYYETYYKCSIKVDILGRYFLLFVCSAFVICCIGKLLIAACRKQFLKAIKMDANWGPKCEILQRSRGMFSAQAMTKEYMYRQYHLQAGIITRQKNANKRNASQYEHHRFSL